MHKDITSEITQLLYNNTALEVSSENRRRMNSMGIVNIYYLGVQSFAEFGIYGNHIVIFTDNKYVDLDISPKHNIEQILDSLS